MPSMHLKVVTSEKEGRTGVTTTTRYLFGGEVMGILLSFVEVAVLYEA